ncbi:hypothetical protein GCM10009712_14940 [Pseudarthrobacter sulfonivorans]
MQAEALVHAQFGCADTGNMCDRQAKNDDDGGERNPEEEPMRRLRQRKRPGPGRGLA